MRIKVKSVAIIVLVVMVLTLFTPHTLADEQQFPSVEYASLTAEMQQLSDPQQWFAYFASDDVQAEISQEARYPQFDPDYIVTTMTCDGVYIEYDPYGMFWIDIDSEIPISYQTEGEGMYLPPASAIEGKYTQQEAQDVALTFLNEIMGIDTSQLILLNAVPEDSSKERSRAYKFEFGYQYDDIYIAKAPSINIAVNDDGIVEANAETVLYFKPSEKAAIDMFVSKDTIINNVASLTEQSPCMPVYYCVNLNDVCISWMFNYTEQESGITLNGWAYDMRSGIELESDLG